MELRLNLATCSLKDAEHAIFLIGAYHGMTQLPVLPSKLAAAISTARNTDVVVSNATSGLQAGVPVAQFVPPVCMSNLPTDPGHAAQELSGYHTHAAHNATPEPPNSDPAQVFAAPAGPLPPDAGESPMAADAAAVFAGNAAGTAPAPVGSVPPSLPVATSAPTAGGPVGSPVALPPAPAASAPTGVELDADGLPWDPRINASGDKGDKPKNKDGRWRAKRGLNDGAMVASVQAELRATMAAGSAPAPVSPAMLPPGTPAAPPAPPAPPPMPPAPPAPPAPPVGALPDPTTFEQLMPRVTDGMMNKGVPQTALNDAVKAYGLPSVNSLAQRPDMVPSVWLYLKTQYPQLAA